MTSTGRYDALQSPLTSPLNTWTNPDSSFGEIPVSTPSSDHRGNHEFSHFDFRPRVLFPQESNTSGQGNRPSSPPSRPRVPIAPPEQQAAFDRVTQIFQEAMIANSALDIEKWNEFLRVHRDTLDLASLSEINDQAEGLLRDIEARLDQLNNQPQF